MFINTYDFNEKKINDILYIVFNENCRYYDNDVNNIIISYIKEIYRGDLYNMLSLYKQKYIKYKSEYLWNLISLKEDLSDQFVNEFADKIKWKYILRNTNISNKILKKYVYIKEIDEQLNNVNSTLAKVYIFISICLLIMFVSVIILLKYTN